jgi:TolA-binding protein
VELERAFWEHDDAVRTHVQGCPVCQPHWADIGALAGACADLAGSPPAFVRRDEIREALRSLTIDPRERNLAGWLRVVAPSAASAAAAAALILWAWPVGRGAAPPPSAAPPQAVAVHRATLLEHDGARFLRVGAQPDEIVRLVDGTLSVDVAPLQPGERFRILTGDAEIEVKGTAFDATVEKDRLVAVRVVHGRVEVRTNHAEAQTLTAGATWTAPATAAAVVRAAKAPLPATVSAAPARALTRRPPRPRPAPPPAAVQTTADAGVPAPVARRAGRGSFLRGWQLLRDGELESAAEELNRAAVLAGTDAEAEDARFWRAVALARGGREGAAMDELVAFVKRYPASLRAGEASVMLGWLLLERGAYDEAERRFRAGVVDPARRVRASATSGLSAVRGARID